MVRLTMDVPVYAELYKCEKYTKKNAKKLGVALKLDKNSQLCRLILINF